MPHHHKQDPTAPPIAPAPDPNAPPTVETPPPSGRSAIDPSHYLPMKTPKLCFVNNIIRLVFWTHYDSAEDTYSGIAFNDPSFVMLTPGPGSSFANWNPGDELKFSLPTPVVGMTAYPNAARPNRDFQCVELDQDSQPLIDIANANAFKAATPPGQPTDSTGQN